MKCWSGEAVQFLGMHPMGSPDFLVRGCGAYAQSRRSWSSQSLIVYVSYRWLLGLMACSLVASLAWRSGKCVVCLWFLGNGSGDFSSTLIIKTCCFPTQSCFRFRPTSSCLKLCLCSSRCLAFFSFFVSWVCRICFSLSVWLRVVTCTRRLVAPERDYTFSGYVVRTVKNLSLIYQMTKKTLFIFSRTLIIDFVLRRRQKITDLI